MKITVLGSTAVGKTACLIAMTDGLFNGEYASTIYDTFGLNHILDSQLHQITLIDTAGHSDYDRFRPIGYPGTELFLIFYACDDRTSFNQVWSKWKPEIERELPGIPWILVRAKCDKEEKLDMLQLVPPSQVSVVLDHQQTPFACPLVAMCSCTAKDRASLTMLLDTAIRQILRSRKSRKNKSDACCKGCCIQ